MLLLQVGRAVPTTPWELVLTSSRETKFVLAILVVFSIASWYLIFLKWWQFRRMRRYADRFMAEIERAPRLDDAYHAAMRLPSSPYNRLLREGIHFFSELKPGGLKENGPAVNRPRADTGRHAATNWLARPPGHQGAPNRWTVRGPAACRRG